ncbi:phenolic acid decarboxylase [Actinokineospora iranica]|uniref:Phenolic acid decarboxylase n=1 Tax=Actinokineospora iranica TaxID=1271860 RepID=A0A1G6S6U2_9PSEU|nr:phenolic acid decarboxylase [Actinokineospora iranica]SDD12652.1 phenolic acid decarboxylase [Actinokineospora iranica]
MSEDDTRNLSGIVGKRFIYTYDSGWQYEMYVKNANTVAYRVHSGLFAGRWVKNQRVRLARLGAEVYKISWTEPTGTTVSVDVLPGRRRLHAVIFLPRWVGEHPERVAVLQDDHVDEMAKYRDDGPTYPTTVVFESAEITFLEDCGPDDETVIAMSPAELPTGHTAQVN